MPLDVTDDHVDVLQVFRCEAVAALSHDLEDPSARFVALRLALFLVPEADLSGFARLEPAGELIG